MKLAGDISRSMPGASLLLAGVAAAALAADPERPSEPQRGSDAIVVGKEVATRQEGAALSPEIEIGGEEFAIPDIADLPIVVSADEDGLRISIGDEVAEATREIDDGWATTDTPYRISFGHDVYIGPEELVVGDVVSIGGDVTVAGTVDGDVVVFAGDVIVEGEVQGDVVAVWGGVELDRTAVCGADVVAIGGAVVQNRGHVEGRTLSLNVLPAPESVPGVETALLVCSVASLVLFGVFAAILGLIFRSNTERVLSEIDAHPFQSFWVGAAAHAMGPIVFLILVVTLVLSPLALVGWLLWWAVAQSGVVIGAVRLGRSLLRPASPRSVLPAALVGGALLHAPFLLGLVAYARGGPGIQTAGVTLLTLASGLAAVMMLVGSGALIRTRFGEGVAPASGEVRTALFAQVDDGQSVS